VRPEIERGYPAANIEEADVILQTILEITDDKEGDSWLWERFGAADADELYLRLMRLYDRIYGTDIAPLFDNRAA
jgi:hypothetical protein